MQIELDEGLLLAATKFLADQESGETVFEFHRSSHEFLRQPGVRERFAADAGRELGGAETAAIGTYVDSIYSPNHYSVFFGNLLDEIDALDEAASRCCRRIAWAFLTAWTMRFGGFRSDLVRNGSLVDPAGHSPAVG